jgi:hypothetical protein
MRAMTRIVPRMETASDPRQPARLEKKKNMGRSWRRLTDRTMGEVRLATAALFLIARQERGTVSAKIRGPRANYRRIYGFWRTIRR